MMIVELSARFTVEFMFNHHHPTRGILTGSLHISPARERWDLSPAQIEPRSGDIYVAQRVSAGI